MTNQEKLQQIYNLTGPDLFNMIIQALGPGTIFIPKDANRARRETRNIAIKADFFSGEFANMSNKEACNVLADRYGLTPDRIRKIVNTSGSR